MQYLYPEGEILNLDEITAFLIAKYVSPTETAFHMYSFHMHGYSHKVVRLLINLPGSEQIYFKEGSGGFVQSAAVKRVNS